MAKSFVKPKEGFDRPDHPDYKTASELQEMNFCGIRHNSINEDVEIWIEGEKVRAISVTERIINPNAVDTALAEVFCLDDVSTTPPLSH